MIDVLCPAHDVSVDVLRISDVLCSAAKVIGEEHHVAVGGEGRAGDHKGRRLRLEARRPGRRLGPQLVVRRSDGVDVVVGAVPDVRLVVWIGQKGAVNCA